MGVRTVRLDGQAPPEFLRKQMEMGRGNRNNLYSNTRYITFDYCFTIFPISKLAAAFNGLANMSPSGKGHSSFTPKQPFIIKYLPDLIKIRHLLSSIFRLLFLLS